MSSKWNFNFGQEEEVEMEEEEQEPVLDIDVDDAHNPLAVVEYVQDLHDFYRKNEVWVFFWNE